MDYMNLDAPEVLDPMNRVGWNSITDSKPSSNSKERRRKRISLAMKRMKVIHPRNTCNSFKK
jgi:hypothetical protein